MTQKDGVFGVLMTRRELDEFSRKLLGQADLYATLYHDKKAGTMWMSCPLGRLFSALHKGGDVWIVMFNKKFFRKK